MSKVLIATAFLAASTGSAIPRTLLEIAGAAPPSFDRDRAALVIIDAQREYRSGVLPLTGFDPALARIASLRDWAHSHGVPVIHIRHVAGPGSVAFAEGSAGADIVPELTPAPGEMVVTKRLPNSFAGTDLESVLARDRRSLLVLTGFMTHMCVEATARAALDRRYTSFVVADATATRDLTAPFSRPTRSSAMPWPPSPIASDGSSPAAGSAPGKPVRSPALVDPGIPMTRAAG